VAAHFLCADGVGVAERFASGVSVRVAMLLLLLAATQREIQIEEVACELMVESSLVCVTGPLDCLSICDGDAMRASPLELLLRACLLEDPWPARLRMRPL
jgi:hypothetical protein